MCDVKQSWILRSCMLLTYYTAVRSELNNPSVSERSHRFVFWEARIFFEQTRESESSSTIVFSRRTDTFGVATQFREMMRARHACIGNISEYRTDWRDATHELGHDGFVRIVRCHPCVYHTPTSRRNKILLKLIWALGHVCKESRQRWWQRGQRDLSPKVDRSVWARDTLTNSSILAYFRLPAVSSFLLSHHRLPFLFRYICPNFFLSLLDKNCLSGKSLKNFETFWIKRREQSVRYISRI